MVRAGAVNLRESQWKRMKLTQDCIQRVTKLNSLHHRKMRAVEIIGTLVWKLSLYEILKDMCAFSPTYWSCEQLDQRRFLTPVQPLCPAVRQAWCNLEKTHVRGVCMFPAEVAVASGETVCPLFRSLTVS